MNIEELATVAMMTVAFIAGVAAVALDNSTSVQEAPTASAAFAHAPTDTRSLDICITTTGQHVRCQRQGNLWRVADALTSQP